MTYPYVKYLGYLLCNSTPVNDCMEIIEQINFPTPSEEYVESLKENYVPIDYSREEGKARELGIQMLYVNGEGVEEARSFLISNIRHTIEVLICGRVEIDDIKKLIYDSHGIRVTPSAIKMYEYLFWDLRKLNSTDFREFINSYKIIEHEWWDLWAAWREGPVAAMSRVGKVGNVDASQAMEDVFESAYLNYSMTAKGDPTNTDTARASRNWANIMLDTYRVRSAEGMAVSQILSALERFILYNDRSLIESFLRKRDPAAGLIAQDDEVLFEGSPTEITIDVLKNESKEDN